MMETPRRARRRGGAGRGAALAATSALLLGLVAAGAARADDWPVYRGDVQHSGVATEKVAPPLSLLWRFTAGSEPTSSSSPAVVGDTVFYSARGVNQGGVLFAVDTKTGSMRWQTPELLNRNVYSTSPLVDGGKVYIGASDGKLYIYDAASGSEVRQFTAGRAVNSAPVINNGVLYFGSNDGVFRAINPETGASIWRQSLKADDGINSSPIIAGNLIYFTTSNNTVYAVNAATGIAKWSNRLQYRFGPNAAVYADNTLYVPSGPRLHAIQPTSGNLRWSTDFPSDLLFAPVAADGIVYVVADNKQMYAVRSNGRADVWKKPVKLPFRAAASPIISGDVIYVPTNQSVLLAISREDGHILWQYRVEPSSASPSIAPPATTSLTAPVSIANKTLYSVSDDGSLSAYRPDAVDTTPPLASNMYPPSGVAVNGAPGLIMAVNLQDQGSGLDPDSIKLSLDGKDVNATYDTATNLVYYRTRATGKIVDPPLSNGRHTLTVVAKDYKGNTLQKDWSFVVDNALPQYRPGATQPTAPAAPNRPNRPGGGAPPGGGYPGGGYPGGGYPGGGYPGGGYPGGRGRGGGGR